MQSVTFAGLRAGEYLFTVRALDAAPGSRASGCKYLVLDVVGSADLAFE